MHLMIVATSDPAALGWHCLWLGIIGLFAVRLFHSAVAELSQPFPEYGSAAVSAALAVGLGLWVFSSAADRERPLRESIERFQIQKAETKRRQAINAFLERYHPALKSGHERVQQLHTEASINLRELQELKAMVKHDDSAQGIARSLSDMKTAEAELAGALERIEGEFEELYAAHQLTQIAGEGWTPEAIRRMKQSAEATLQMAQIANQETHQLAKQEQGQNRP